MQFQGKKVNTSNSIRSSIFNVPKYPSVPTPTLCLQKGNWQKPPKIAAEAEFSDFLASPPQFWSHHSSLQALNFSPMDLELAIQNFPAIWFPELASFVQALHLSCSWAGRLVKFSFCQLTGAFQESSREAKNSALVLPKQNSSQNPFLLNNCLRTCWMGALCCKYIV